MTSSFYPSESFPSPSLVFISFVALLSPKISAKEAGARIYIGYLLCALALLGVATGFVGDGTVCSLTAAGIMLYRMGVQSQ